MLVSANIFVAPRLYLHFRPMKCSKQSTKHFLQLILPLDVAERAFSRCVETNEGKDEVSNEEVHADSYKLRVTFNYEFLEDFQEEQSSVKQSSGEEGPTNIDARYIQCTDFLDFTTLYIVIVYPPTVLSPGSQRNSQSTVTHSFCL